MNKFQPINLYTNPQPIPSTFNEGFSQYETIKYLIGLVNQLIENQNSDVDELADLHAKKKDLQSYLDEKTISDKRLTDLENLKLSILTYQDDITNKRKLSPTGDFTGTLNGYPIVQDSTGLSSMVNGHETEIQSINSQLNDIPNQTYITEKAKTVDVNNLLVFKSDKTTTDALQTNKADISYVDIKFGSMGNTKTFKGSCTFATLPSSGMLVDDYWYVTDKTTNYCYNGTSWVDIGNSLKIGDKTIFPSNNAYVADCDIFLSAEQAVIKTVNGTGVDITINATLYAINTNGGGAFRKTLTVPNVKYTVPHNGTLLWNHDTNALEVHGNKDAGITNNVMLVAHVHNGVVKNGILKDDYYTSKPPLGSDLFFTGTSTWQSDLPGGYGYGVTLKLSGGTLYASSITGGNWMKSLAVDTSYVIPHNSVLIWDLDANALVIQNNKAIRPINNILLASVHNGLIKSGYFKTSYLLRDGDLVTDEYFKNSVPSTCNKNVKIINGFNAGQSFTIVKDELWVFNEAPDDHSAFTGTLTRYNKYTFAQIGNVITHNLAHCNAVDYNAKNDCLLIANGSGDATLKPSIYIFPNVSNWVNLTQADFNTIDKVVINFYDALRADISLPKANACWGEDNNGKNNIIYLSGNNQKKIFKIILGMGLNNLSVVPTPDTLINWGSFLSGKSDTQYNGTAKIIKTFTSTVDFGSNQGIIFYDGGLLSSIGFTNVQAVHLQLLNNNSIRCDKAYTTQILDDSGNNIDVEPEGVTILDGLYLLQGYRGALEGLSITPLSNRQGGKGVTGTPINFYFKCNSIPNILITPTSNTTDLYISSVSQDGFTVSTKSGVTGATFNWECAIS